MKQARLDYMFTSKPCFSTNHQDTHDEMAIAEALGEVDDVVVDVSDDDVFDSADDHLD